MPQAAHLVTAILVVPVTISPSLKLDARIVIDLLGIARHTRII
jgi:hypothetical protein